MIPTLEQLAELGQILDEFQNEPSVTVAKELAGRYQMKYTTYADQGTPYSNHRNAAIKIGYCDYVRVMKGYTSIINWTTL